MKKVDRRSFIRVASLGAAAAATGLRPSPAGASARAKQSFKPAANIAASLTQAGPELALPAGFTYQTFGAFGVPQCRTASSRRRSTTAWACSTSPAVATGSSATMRSATPTTTSPARFSATRRPRTTRRLPAAA